MRDLNNAGNVLAHWHERWRDPAISVLLVVQCITVYALIPVTASTSMIPSRAVGVLPLLFASFVMFMTQLKWAMRIGSAALLLSAAVAVLECLQRYPWAVVGEDGLALTTFLLLTAAVVATVFSPGRFSMHRALGSIVLYINIGLLFTLVYRLIWATSAGSFFGLPKSGGASAFRAALEYFSFSTLTSVGFGDIMPVSPLARGFTILEASIGHLYPATLLARVVTRAMHERGE